MNEIFGEDIKCALQLSGHLRYYKDLNTSLQILNNYTTCDYFIFAWSDNIGLKIEPRDINMTNELNNISTLFNPKSIKIENNKHYLSTNLLFSNFTVLESGCTYSSVKSQFYTIFKANELRKTYQEENNVYKEFHQYSKQKLYLSFRMLLSLIYLELDFQNFEK
jgi:hypothetical protein